MPGGNPYGTMEGVDISSCHRNQLAFHRLSGGTPIVWRCEDELVRLFKKHYILE
jgi:hypothetical protein